MVRGVDLCGDVSNIVDELLSEWRRFVDWVSTLDNDTSRFLAFAAWLNSFLESRGYGRIIIVGGFSVEVYTGSTYRTLDVDLVVEGETAYKVVKCFLEQIPHERTSRVYFLLLPALASKAIDIVDTLYSGSRPPIKVEVNSYYVYIETPEELLVKYLVAWKYRRSDEDRNKAILLAKTLYDRLDMEYVRKRVKEEGVEDVLSMMLELVGGDSNG